MNKHFFNNGECCLLAYLQPRPRRRIAAKSTHRHHTFIFQTKDISNKQISRYNGRLPEKHNAHCLAACVNKIKSLRNYHKRKIKMKSAISAKVKL